MKSNNSKVHPFLLFAICLFGILLVLFRQSLDPSKVFFSNDGPLGSQSQDAMKLPTGFTGIWLDLNTIGIGGGTLPADFNFLLLWILGPHFYAKFEPFFDLFFLGCCAWFFFRQLKLNSWACFLGGLVAALNSGWFSTVCWGVGAQMVCVGFCFLALAALVSEPPRWPWVRFVLAGLSTGMAVIEGADIGVLFSFFVAAFGVFWGLTSAGPTTQKLARAFGGVATVTLFALMIAAQTISVQFNTAIKGVSDAKHDTMTPEARWRWATQWSSPKGEFLSLVVPGLFGFRMNTPMEMAAFQEYFEGGQYWGRGGRDASWDDWFAKNKQGDPPQGFIRHAGGGGYEGVMTVLIVVFAACQALRKKDSIYPLHERRVLWFCLGMAVVCLLIAWGRYAPFYRLVYKLPYFSSIRNPSKFGHLFNLSMMILFAYGVHGLARRYLEVASVNGQGIKARVKSWWTKVTGFDRRWAIGCWVTLAISLLGWLIYASSRGALEKYLQEVQFDETMAKGIAGFSIKQVGWFILFFILSAGSVILIMSGAFAGGRAKWGAFLIGSILVVDLSLANQPWLVFWDWKQKYATNPVIDCLKQKPYEHRVSMPRFQFPPEFGLLGQLYGIEWSQHLFLYYNIQPLDIIQMPRMPEDLMAFEMAVGRDPVRRWQLTNTRYLLGPAMMADGLNQQLDPEKKRFRLAMAFDIQPKPDVTQATRLEELTAVTNAAGKFGLTEFTGALPRAKLYPTWEVSTNDQATLDRLVSKEFDPEKSVWVSEPLPPPHVDDVSKLKPGVVEFANYAPTRIVLKTGADYPSMLLLNDKYDPDWKVYVDGRQERVLRCNFIMRGVNLSAGPHTVEFRYQPSTRLLYVSLSAIGLGLLLLVMLFVGGRGDATGTPASRQKKA